MKKIFGALVGLGFMAAGASAQAFVLPDTIFAASGSSGITIGSCIGLTTCEIDKTYTQIGSKSLSITVEASPGTKTYILDEDIFNNTGISWTDFHWDIGAELATGDSVAFTAAVIPAFSNIIVMADEIWADGGIINSGITPLTADITVSVTNGGSSLKFIQFFVGQAPSIPEPGTLALFGLGLLGFGFARRKRMI